MQITYTSHNLSQCTKKILHFGAVSLNSVSITLALCFMYYYQQYYNLRLSIIHSISLKFSTGFTVPKSDYGRETILRSVIAELT